MEAQLGDREFIVGDSFTHGRLRRRAGALVRRANVPLEGNYPRIAAYLERLNARPPSPAL